MTRLGRNAKDELCSDNPLIRTTLQLLMSPRRNWLAELLLAMLQAGLAQGMHVKEPKFSIQLAIAAMNGESGALQLSCYDSLIGPFLKASAISCSRRSAPRLVGYGVSRVMLIRYRLTITSHPLYRKELGVFVGREIRKKFWMGNLKRNFHSSTLDPPFPYGSIDSIHWSSFDHRI
jgi:hypothetical protein